MNLLLLVLLAPGFTVKLEPRALEEFQNYVRAAERNINTTAASSRPIWARASTDRIADIRQGKIVVSAWGSEGSRQVEKGLIHDWVGAAFVPGATISDAFAVLQDLPAYPSIYKPEVLDARWVQRDGSRGQVFLRLVVKKALVVVLDSYYNVDYKSVRPGRSEMWSISTKIQEVENAGQAAEEVQPPDVGNGFLWRLNSYWEFEESDGGLYMQLRAVSLSRDVPAMLAWLIKPIVTSVPKESLSKTLQDTRDAVSSRSAKKP
jgi:hypothetical protein